MESIAQPPAAGHPIGGPNERAYARESALKRERPRNGPLAARGSRETVFCACAHGPIELSSMRSATA